MKREEVLFYLTTDKIHIYLVHAQKELVKEIDTTSFFKWGEISNVQLARKSIDKLVDEEFVMTGILKPLVRVLYNDITNCDLQELYKIALYAFNFGNIEFIGFSELFKEFKDFDRLVIYEKDYFTVLKERIKSSNIDMLPFKPIIIGQKNIKETHYSDQNFLWNTFKDHFTNR